jgi:hypothetical protein
MARDEIDPACVRDLRNILHEKRRIRDLRKTHNKDQGFVRATTN